MGWANWIVWTMRLWLLAKRYGPMLATLYGDIISMIAALKDQGVSTAMLAYYKNQAVAGLKDQDEGNLHDLRAVVKEHVTSNSDRGMP